MNTVSRRRALQVAAHGAWLAAAAAWPGSRALASPAPTLGGAAPLVIAHRGASGYRPEHTLAAYDLAISQGAHFIEPDLVMSLDGELLARHEPMLARVVLNADASIRQVDGAPVLHRTDTSTNVWQLPKYASRLKVKKLDGRPVGGWWVEDFTAAELRADIRAQERLRDLRTSNNAFNDQFPVPTLHEVIALAKARSASTGRPIGVYPETKHPSYFKAFTDVTGLPRMEDRLLEILHAEYGQRAEAPVFIQSFEVANLQYLRGKTGLRLVQLLSNSGQPYDFTLAGDPRGYQDLAKATATGLDFIRRHADGIGPHTNLMIPLAGGRLSKPTTLVADAHARGLVVHGYTFRAENSFLPDEFDIGTEAAAIGNLRGQLQAFLDLGMDGFFTDQPDLGVAALRR
jgi:glycerophosphoryl diester phosphodiesterase